MKRILFITSVPPLIVKEYLKKDDWSNEMLPTELLKMEAVVVIKAWTDNDIIPTIMENDTATFLWAEDYIRYPLAFQGFLQDIKTEFQHQRSNNIFKLPCIVNHVDLVLWNMDKKYLLELKDAGYCIPNTDIIDSTLFSSADELHDRIKKFQPSGAVVLKPVVSASSEKTHLIADVESISESDHAYLESCTNGTTQCNLMLQQFEPDIAKGEYSFIYVGRLLSHVVLKTPRDGEFRVQSAFGGHNVQKSIEAIDGKTMVVVNSIFEYLIARFNTCLTGKMGYVRIDGLVTDDHPFVLMEIEAIEPELHLKLGGLQELVALLLH